MERFYPSFFGGMIAIVLFVWNPSIPDKFEKIIDSTIMFTSIIVGFLGVLVSVLVTIKNSDILKAIYERAGAGLLKKYVRNTILAGLITVVISAVLYVLQDDTLRYVLIVWATTVTYFVLSAYRITDILMNVIFLDAEGSHRRPKGLRMSPEEEKRYRESNKK